MPFVSANQKLNISKKKTKRTIWKRKTYGDSYFMLQVQREEINPSNRYHEVLKHPLVNKKSEIIEK